MLILRTELLESDRTTAGCYGSSTSATRTSVTAATSAAVEDAKLVSRRTSQREVTVLCRRQLIYGCLEQRIH